MDTKKRKFLNVLKHFLVKTWVKSNDFLATKMYFEKSKMAAKKKKVSKWWDLTFGYLHNVKILAAILLT